MRLVILDGCRNNPLARSMHRTPATRTLSGGSFADLNEDLLGDKTLVTCAAAGTTAADGRGRNSPYTAALLSHLDAPLEIGLLFRRVRAQVLAATNCITFHGRLCRCVWGIHVTGVARHRARRGRAAEGHADARRVPKHPQRCWRHFPAALRSW